MRIILALCAAAALAGEATAAERPVALKEAQGRDTVANLCSGCHSLDYIRINAPFMNRQVWTAEVNKMVQVFGAPIPAPDAAKIIDYLAANYGPPG
jgi:sulfite dehydrogenase (cytochrome) subunit B